MADHYGPIATKTLDRRAGRSDGNSTGSDFSRLGRYIAEAGLLRRRPVYYAVRIGVVSGLFAAGWAAFFAAGNSWWTLAAAASLAFVFGQIALVSHDVAHRQVFSRRRPSECAGRILGNLAIGMSYGWWMNKHTRHHANPNHEELDPDVVPDILVWSKRQAGSSSGLPRFIGRYQAFLFFPLLTLEGFNLHVSGIRAVFSPSTKKRALEGLLLLAHVAGYLSAVFLTLPVGKAVVFVMVNQCLFGAYLGSIFAPNHKGMTMVTGEQELDFLRRQVLTSRNVRGGWFVDIVLGGLNYQIEHHLFPSMPTPHLRHAQRVVRSYCFDIGVPYHETGLLQSYREALRYLHSVSLAVRESGG